VTLLAVPLLAGCGPSYGAAALAARVGPTFANLYTRGQVQAGRTDVTPAALHVATTCRRGGGDTLDNGPGDDWHCLVVFHDPALGPKQVAYDVVLKPEGCFTAEGPPAEVGDARVRDAVGTLRPNPVYAFDGCL
jgi:hypothetical protein